MESFAAKVRYGSGTRFDPMMEEKGGWIAGETRGRDEDMPDAVIEILAEANQRLMGEEPNPFKGHHGEVLPPNLDRSFNGFLVREDALKFKVDTEKMLARIAKLKDQLLICKFVGPKPPPHIMKMWIQALHQELRGNTLSFCRNVGKGYFILSGDNEDALTQALMLTPFRSKWGTCMLQSWVPGFNPDNPSNLAFPTWVSLRNLPLEHQDQALAIAESLGEVIGMDVENDNARDPRFCINLEISKGWVTSIDLECERGMLASQKIMLDYDQLPITCRICLSWKHEANECNEMQRKPHRRTDLGRSSHTYHHYQNKKGKNIVVDEEGFQQVRSRKNTRRNIFENRSQLPRSYTADPRPEGAASDTATAAAPTAALNRQARENKDLTTEDELEDGPVGNQGRRSSEVRSAGPGIDPGMNLEGPTETTALLNA